MLLLLCSYGQFSLPPGWARVRNRKGLPIFKTTEEEEEMKLSIILAERLTEALSVAGVVLDANKQLLETNAALRSSMRMVEPNPVPDKPPMDPAKKAELLARLEQGRLKQAQNERLEE